MLGSRTYRDLEAQGNFPPNQYLAIGGTLEVVAIIFLLMFGQVLTWNGVAIVIGLAIYGEILAQTGWPFFQKSRSSS